MAVLQYNQEFAQMSLGRAPGVNDAYKPRVTDMKRWQEYLRSMGADYLVRYDIGYDLGIEIEKNDPKDVVEEKAAKLKAHFYNSSVYLARYMTGIVYFGPDGKEIEYLPNSSVSSFSKIACDYQGIRVHYERNKDSEKFYLTGLKGDSNSPLIKTDEKYLNNVLKENIKGAIILVQNAKASGWESVTFGDTQDPLKRLALRIVCQKLGMDCSSEKFNPDEIPDTYHGNNLLRMMGHDVIADYENFPTLSPKFEEKKVDQPVVKTIKTEIDDEDWGDGFVPPTQPPAPAMA